MPFDTRAFRNAMGCFATGVAVATAQDPETGPVGVTINSLSSVSLDPPLILFCLNSKAHSFATFIRTRTFAINILAEDQRELSVRFSMWPLEKRWAGLAHSISENGNPLLADCQAVLDCTTQTQHDGGDHVILIGRVVDLHCHPVGRPLVYYRGHYALLDQRTEPS
ncbi:Flavin reductase [uncultured Gammaproteobacteria bacterium]